MSPPIPTEIEPDLGGAGAARFTRVAGGRPALGRHVAPPLGPLAPGTLAPGPLPPGPLPLGRLPLGPTPVELSPLGSPPEAAPALLAAVATSEDAPGDYEPPPDLRKGLRWSFLSQTIIRMVSMLSGIALVRLLGIEQFGVYAFALSITAVMISINDLGQVVAIVRFQGSDVERAARTAASLSIAMSTSLYVAVFFAAPWLANVFGGGEGAGVLRLLTIVVVLDAFTTAPRGLLLRTFRQKRLALADLVSVPVNAAVSVGLAIAGVGAWAPAGGTVAAALVTCSAVIITAPQVPFPGFDRAAARQLLSFGLPLAGTTFIEYLLINADNLIVGSVLGVSALGLYALAFNISSWPATVVTQAVPRVSIPEFARLSDDPEAARSTFTRSLVLLSTVLFPLCALLAVLATPLVSFVYGQEKVNAAAVLRWLAVLGAMRVLVGFVFDYLVGLGRSRLTFVLQTCWLVALAPALVIGAHVDGIRGAAIAHVLVALLVALPMFLDTLRRASIDLPAIGRQLLRPALGVVAMVALSALVRPLLPVPFVHLLVFGPLLLVAYTLVAIPSHELARRARPLLHRGTT